MAIVIAVSEPMRLYLQFWWNRLDDLWFSIRRALF
jgi:hypothetical protein